MSEALNKNKNFLCPNLASGMSEALEKNLGLWLGNSSKSGKLITCLVKSSTSVVREMEELFMVALGRAGRVVGIT